MGTTERLARFVVETSFEDIPPEAITTTKRQLLDTVGVTLAGAREPISRIATEYVRDLGCAPKAGVMAAGFKTSAAYAAFANGIMSHVLDYDDVGAFGHASVVLVPAILALGEEFKVSGKEAIAAYFTGYGVGIAVESGFTYAGEDQIHGLHSTPTFGVMACTAATAKIARLNVEQTRMALGMAASQAGGVLRNNGTMTKSMHVGNACRNAVTVAILAKRGATASVDVVEGRFGYSYAVLGEGNYDLEKMTKDLGDPSKMFQGLGIKKYPSCYGNHWALDAILQLVKEHNITYDDVESIEVGIDPYIHNILFYHQPKAGLEGKFSMEYNMAAALLDREIVHGTFTDERAADPRLQEAIAKVKLTVHPEWPIDRKIRRSSVTIKLKDGRVVSNPGNRVKGYRDWPLSKEELQDKYRDNARRVLSEKDTDRSMALLENLEEVKDISELMGILTT